MSETELAVNQVLQILSDATERLRIASLVGQSYGGKRDMFAALGYNKEPKIADFRTQYRLQHIAKRCVKAYPDATWRTPPRVTDDQNDKTETAFERAFLDLDKRFKIFSRLRKADRLAGLGRYAVILIGLDGAGNEWLDQPAAPGNLIYLRPYGEDKATIQKWDTDTASARFGLPVSYSIQTGADAGALAITVHHSRVIHIAEDTLDNDVYGDPRLEPVFNLIEDLTKTVGGSAECFWRDAFRGLHADIDKDAVGDDASIAKMQEALENYVHELTRVIRTKGVTLNELGGNAADPTGQMMATLKLISGALGIPLRILIGNEAGELASTQDDKNWSERVAERQQIYAEPVILCPLVDRLIELQALVAPARGQYDVEWPDLMALSDDERAGIVLKKAQAANILMPGNGHLVYTPEEARGDWGMDATPEGAPDLADLLPLEADPMQQAPQQTGSQAAA